MYRKGYALFSLKRYKEALSVFDSFINTYGNTEELSLKRKTASALLLKGNSLSWLDRFSEARHACNEVIRRFGNETDSDLKESVEQARENKKKFGG